MHSQLLGQLGEQLARNFLEEKGYVFVEANFRTQFGEIDLIMKDSDQIVFIEVKTRKAHNAITGTADLPEAKIQKLESAALSWIAQQDDPEWRMELVEVNTMDNGLAKIRVTVI